MNYVQRSLFSSTLPSNPFNLSATNKHCKTICHFMSQHITDISDLNFANFLNGCNLGDKMTLVIMTRVKTTPNVSATAANKDITEVYSLRVGSYIWPLSHLPHEFISHNGAHKININLLSNHEKEYILYQNTFSQDLLSFVNHML